MTTDIIYIYIVVTELADSGIEVEVDIPGHFNYRKRWSILFGSIRSHSFHYFSKIDLLWIKRKVSSNGFVFEYIGYVVFQSSSDTEITSGTYFYISFT